MSVGILGKVFTFNEEKIRENIEESVTEDMNEFLDDTDDTITEDE